MSQEEDDAENALVAELRALAGGPEGDRFVLTHRGRSITVTHNSGSSSNVTFRASYDAAARADHPALTGAGASEGTYRAPPRSDQQALIAPRPLAIVLRTRPREGLPTAYVTGDRAFDGSVFVDTPTTNQAVLAAVLGPEVRAAVLALFELDFHRITIDDEGFLDGSDVVEAYLWTFASSEPPRARAARGLDAFVSLLDHLPKITASGEGPAFPKTPVWVNVSGWLGLAGVLAWLPVGFFVDKVTQSQDGAPLAIATLLALASGLLCQWIVASTLRRQLGMPHDGSFARVFFSRIKVFFGAAAFVFFIVSLGFVLGAK
jgi:hypothetical protein